MHPAAKVYGLVGRRFDFMEKGEADKREIPCWKKFRQIVVTPFGVWETRPPGWSRDSSHFKKDTKTALTILLALDHEAAFQKAAWSGDPFENSDWVMSTVMVAPGDSAGGIV
jgi:hypothetical protein